MDTEGRERKKEGGREIMGREGDNKEGRVKGTQKGKKDTKGKEEGRIY